MTNLGKVIKGVVHAQLQMLRGDLVGDLNGLHEIVFRCLTLLHLPVKRLRLIFQRGDLLLHLPDPLSVSGGASATLAENLDSGCGRQTLVLREGGTAVQTVNVPAAGEYEVSFVQAHRPYLSPHQVPITAFIDDQPVVSVPARATRDTGYLRYSGKVTLTAGEHTFKLLSGETAGVGGGNDLLFDDVSIAPVASTVVIDGTLALESGSTLVLNNDKPIRWLNVTVDGKAVKGGKASLIAAGVTIEGNGTFSAGPQTGLFMLLR